MENDGAMYPVSIPFAVAVQPKDNLKDFYYRFGSELVKQKLENLISDELDTVKKEHSPNILTEKDKDFQTLVVFINSTRPKVEADVEIGNLKEELSDLKQ